MPVRTASFLLVVCVAFAIPAPATILVYHSVEELASMSNEVALGQVRGVESYSSQDGRSIYTVVTLEVTESLSGGSRPGQHLKVHFFGGEKDGVAVRYVGMPEFQVGEEAVLFLKWSEADRYTLVALTLGKLEIVRGDDGPRAVRRLEGMPILSTEEEGPGLTTGRDEFYTIEELRARVRGAGREPRRERIHVR
jgi:hypothetical protein